MFSETLIDSNSPIYQDMMTLSEGDKVRFSGQLFKDEDGILELQNLTMRGKVKNPEFTFKFSNIQKID